jgi:hypothetical protein
MTPILWPHHNLLWLVSRYALSVKMRPQFVEDLQHRQSREMSLVTPREYRDFDTLDVWVHWFHRTRLWQAHRGREFYAGCSLSALKTILTKFAGVVEHALC